MPARRKLTVTEQVEALYQAVPATGEIEYTTLYDNVVASGNKDALNHLQSLKHEGRLKIRVESNPDTFSAKTFVSRA